MRAWQALLTILCIYPTRTISKKLNFRQKFLKSSSTLNIGSRRCSTNPMIGEGHGKDMDQPLRAGILQNERAIKWDSLYEIDKDGQFNFLAGTAGTIWNYVSRYSGLDFNITSVLQSWGPVKGSNDTLYDALKSGDIDVSLSLISHCCERYLGHDFTHIVFERKFGAVFVPSDVEGDIYLDIFAVDLWLGALVTVLLLAFVLYQISRVGNENMDSGKFGLADCLSWLFCIITQQGFTKDPIMLSGKIIVLLGFILGMIMFHSFAANVMTILSRANIINSLSGLIESPTMEIYYSNFPPFQNELIVSVNPEVQALVHKILSKSDSDTIQCQEPNPNICDNQLMNEIIFKGDPNLAFVAPEPYLSERDYFSFNQFQNLACKLKWITIPIGRQKMFYGLRKHLPQRNRINRALYRFHETGLLQKARMDHTPHRSTCETSATLHSKAVSIQQVFGAFACLLVGHGVSIILFVGEALLCNKNES